MRLKLHLVARQSQTPTAVSGETGYGDGGMQRELAYGKIVKVFINIINQICPKLSPYGTPRVPHGLAVGSSSFGCLHTELCLS